jgi:hypothetical protein
MPAIDALPDPSAATDAPPLSLHWLDPASLADNPANWREHPPAQTEALAAVLDKAGWAGVLLYNRRTEHLIDGHARKRIALERGEDARPQVQAVQGHALCLVQQP